MTKAFITGLFLFLASILNAQDIQFGVYVAPQFSWLSPEAKEIKSDGSIVKFSGGLVINKYFAENYAFSSGIAIAGQGGKLSYSNSANNTLQIYDSVYNLQGKTVKYSTQYINIPVGLRLRSNEIGYMRFHVTIGFTNQFNISSKATDLTDSDFENDDIKDEVNLYNLGYYFGGGIDYALGEDTSVFLTIVYENGFLDVLKSDPRVNSRVISARIGINF